MVFRLEKGDEILLNIHLLMAEMSSVKEDFRLVKSNVTEVAEIIRAWKNLKGFHNTLSFISKIAKISAIMIGTGITLWAFTRATIIKSY